MQDSVADSAVQADEAMRSRVASRAAALTLALLIPFLGYRIATANWLVCAIIVAVIGTMVAVIVFLRRGGSGVTAMHVVVGVYSAGVVAASHALDFSGLLWLYPLLVANFYCLPRVSALAINTVAIAAVTPVLLEDHYLGIRVLATLGLVFTFGWVFSKQLEHQRRQLARLALQDTLTGTGNRRALNQALAEARYAQRRYGRPVSLVILDIDHFKCINDELGHQAGDQVLAQVGQFLRQRLRQSDRVFRFGGEEFVALLPETPLAEAARLADELRRRCTELDVAGVERLTFSAGAAELGGDESVDGWLQRADEALYRAKAEGRDRVMTANRAGA